MKEHRLIERMVNLMKAELVKAGRVTGSHRLVEAAVDFFRIYADRTIMARRRISSLGPG